MKKNGRQERERHIREFVNSAEFQPVFASWVIGHGDALEWAAEWLVNSAKANSDPKVIEFAENIAATFNAARIKV